MSNAPHVFDLTWREIATLLVILPLADVALDSTVVSSLIDKGLVDSERGDESGAEEVYITDAGRKVVEQFQRIV